MSELREQALPQNLEAEAAILGGVLIDNARLSDALELITAADFFRSAHKTIFGRIVRIAEQHQAIDLVTLKNDLAAAGLLEEVGGPSYLSALIDGVSRSVNVKHYAAIVREKAKLRDLIHAGNRMIAQAYDQSDEAAEILASAERLVLGLAERTVPSGFEAMKDIASRGLEMLELAAASRTRVSGIPSGFTELDDITRGFQPGQVITIGARPGVGKTSFAMNVAAHAALAGHVTGVFSLEMEKSELFMRLVAALARIDSHRLQSGYIGEAEWRRIVQAIGELAESTLFIDETPAINLFEVRARARRLKAEHGLQLLVLDYLQLMAAHEKLNNRSLEIGAITSALKALAKELKVPIVLLSQLSRDPEKRGTRPRLSDLRDSGSIEQDSDVVMFLHRPETPDVGDTDAVVEVILAKHRGGPIGTVKLTWHDRETRFADYDRYQEPEARALPIGDR